MRPFGPYTFGSPAALGGLYSAAVTQFFNRLATPPDAGRTALYVALIDGLVADGVWAKLEVLYVFAAADAPTALTNLTNGTYSATAVNTPTFAADRGYTGDAISKHVTLGFIPSGGTLFQQNDASIGVWCRTAAAASTQPALGRTTAVNSLNLYPRYTADVLRGALNGGSQVALGAVATAVGLSCIERVNSATIEGFRNGASTGTAASGSSGRGGTQLAVLRDDTVYSAQQVAAAVIAATLGATLELALYNRLQTYMTGVGA